MFCTGNYNASSSERRDRDFLTMAYCITATTAFAWSRADTDADRGGGGAEFIPEEFCVDTLVYCGLERAPESIFFYKDLV